MDANKTTPGIPAPEANANDPSLVDLPQQSTFLTGQDLAALAVEGHLSDPSPPKKVHIAACRKALLDALAVGPSSMAAARARVGLSSPPDVEPRAAGGASTSLLRAGLIEPDGDRFEKSPWRNCHASPSQVWRLVVTRG